MFQKIKQLLRRKTDRTIAEQQITHGPECFRTIASTDPNFDDEHIDPLLLAAMNRCIETGKGVITNCDENGNCTMKDFD